MTKKLIIIGAGGHGKVVADTAICMNKWNEIVFVDAAYPTLTEVLNLPVVGDESIINDKLDTDTEVIVATGDNARRRELLTHYIETNIPIATVIHPSASVSNTSHIEPGVFIGPQAVVNANASIGLGSIINSAAVVEHDCQIAECVHIAPRSACSGGVSIGHESWIGVGATVIQNITIAENVCVGAGAVVINDLSCNIKVVGVPAKKIL